MKIGIDTNVLVRYITQDDAKQAAITTKLIEKYAGQSKSILLNNIVLCELVWVLERGYKYDRSEIIKLLTHIFSTKEFCFESRNHLWMALTRYDEYGCDFADALIGVINESEGGVKTYSFDKKTHKLEEFVPL